MCLDHPKFKIQFELVHILSWTSKSDNNKQGLCVNLVFEKSEQLY